MSYSDMARSPQGSLVGPIWIAAGDVGGAFPEVGWTDFPVVLLGTWIPSLRRLAAHGQTAECRFMDGPYHFTVSIASDDEWRVACFERREGPSASNAVAEWFARPPDFLGSALAAAQGALGYCDARGWWDADTDRLRDAIAFADPDAAS